MIRNLIDLRDFLISADFNVASGSYSSQFDVYYRGRVRFILDAEFNTITLLSYRDKWASYTHEIPIDTISFCADTDMDKLIGYCVNNCIFDVNDIEKLLSL